MAERFRLDQHIRRRAEFSRVFDEGIRAHGRFMTLVLLPTDHEQARLGIAASRKLGGAVRRNRAKRLIRELFRRHKLSGLDIVVIPRRELLEAEFATLEADYRSMLKRPRRRRA
jgi:ribonuclease P protein component